MFFLSFIAAFAASISSLTAYLQAESAWWKGPLASFALYVLAMLVITLVPADAVQEIATFPVSGVITAALACSALVGAGALVSLVLRYFWAPGRIALVVFVGGWFVIFITILFSA